MILINEIECIPLNPDQYVIVNLINAACDIISKDIYDKLMRNDFEHLEESVLGALKKRRYLFSSQKSYDSFITKLNRTIDNKELESAPNFLLVPTYGCNLKCIYCYEQKYNISCHNNCTGLDMGKLQIQRMDEFVAKHFPKVRPADVRVTLMGGEPLLKANKELISYFLKELRARKYIVSAVTNGVDLDYFLDDLIKYKVDYVQITLDGTKELHDKRRIDARGRGSFDKIVKNIELALKKGLSVDLRVNVDQTNIDNLPKLADYLVKNFGKYSNLSAYIYLLQDGGCAGNSSILNEERSIYSILEQEKKYPNMKIFRKAYHGSEFIDAIFNNHEFYPILRHCAASKNQYILDARGDIYKCWHGIGDNTNAVGNFDKKWDIDSEKENIWKNKSVLLFDKCKKCKYRYICGSGCPAAEPDKNGKFNCNRYRCVDFKNILTALVLTNIQVSNNDK